MRFFGYTVLLALLGAMLLAFANCGKGRVPSSPAVKSSDGPAASVEPASRGQPELTAEDQMLLKMPYEQRLRHLRQLYRELVFELHGVRIEDDGAKSASGEDEDHKVCAKVSNPEPKEDLALIRDGNSWQWDLSFLERLCGDYDWSGTVAIADLTPIAVHFGHEPNGEGNWPDPADYSIDRLASDDGRITIADVTPIAMNFGKHLIGYNVYFLPYGQNDWESVREHPIAQWRRGDLGNWEDTGYRTKWKSDAGDEDTAVIEREFSAAYICSWANRQYLNNGDKLTVLPIFLVLGQEVIGTEEMRSDVVTITIPPDHLPVPEIAVNPTIGPAPLEVTFTGSATDEDEGDRILRYDFGIYKIVNGGEQYKDDIYEKEGDQDFDGEMHYTFVEPGIYVVKLTVTSGNENHTGANQVPVVSEQIRVTGPPDIWEFKADPHPQIDEDPLEAPVEVLFTAKVRDTDLIGIASVQLDVFGTGIWVGADTLVLQDPPEDCEYIATLTYEFLPEQIAHNAELPSQVKAEDSAGFSYKALEPSLRISHAVPHAALTTQPSPGCIFVGESVTFDASDSYDHDGPNGLPTKFEFDFDGDETPDEIQEYDDYFDEYGDPIQDGYGIANFPDGHQYNSAGLYTARVTVHDDMYDENDPFCGALHTDNEEIEIGVYGPPRPSTLGEIDSSTVWDGSMLYPNVQWDLLGDPCIAVAINPVTLLPAVVYSAIPLSQPAYWPQTLVLYTQMTGPGLWDIPELVWSGTEEGSTENRGSLGPQCDIEFHPVVASEEGQLPYVAVTYNYKNIWYQTTTSEGIYLYERWFDGSVYRWYRGEGQDVLYAGYIHQASPIRLVVNTEGQFVHFRGEDDTHVLSLCEISPDYEGIPVIVETAEGVDMPHDQKPYLGDLTQRRTATAYVQNLANPIVEYEVMTESFNWIPHGQQVGQRGFTETMSRCLSLDYFGSEEYGILWADDSDRQSLVFHSWKGPVESEEEPDLGAEAGYSCDFDYEGNLPIPCVAYDKKEWISLEEWRYKVYFTAKIRTSLDPERWEWITPIEVDILNAFEQSHLDLDAANGYVYIVYTKGGVIHYAVVDFFQGNR